MCQVNCSKKKLATNAYNKMLPIIEIGVKNLALKYHESKKT